MLPSIIDRFCSGAVPVPLLPLSALSLAVAHTAKAEATATVRLTNFVAPWSAPTSLTVWLEDEDDRELDATQTAWPQGQGADSASVQLSWDGSLDPQLIQPLALLRCTPSTQTAANCGCLLTPAGQTVDTWSARVARFGASNRNANADERLSDARAAEFTPSLTVANFSSRQVRFSMQLSGHAHVAFGFVLDGHLSK